MSTFKEIVYLALEELKLTSDDSYYTEDHILFLLNKYRAFLLKLRYSDIKKQMPESNYLTIALTLEGSASTEPVTSVRMHLTSSELIDSEYTGAVTVIVYINESEEVEIVFDTIDEAQDMSNVKDKVMIAINSTEHYTATLIDNDILIYQLSGFTGELPWLYSNEITYTGTLTNSIPNHSTRLYLRSNVKVPFLMQIGSPRVYSYDYYDGDIAFVSRDRMRYTGNNRFTLNFIYCSINPDSKLYFKSYNKDFLLLTQVYMTGIFLDCIEASVLDGGTAGDVMDKTFPIEESLISPLIELVMKELLGVKYIPKDEENNASDDMSNTQMKK